MKWIKSVADADEESRGNGPFFDQSGFQIAFWHKAQMDYILHSWLQMLQLMTFLLVETCRKIIQQ